MKNSSHLAVLCNDLLHLGRLAPSTVVRINRSGSSQVWDAAGRLLGESGVPTRCRVSGARCPHSLKKRTSKTGSILPKEGRFLIVTHQHPKDSSWKLRLAPHQIWVGGATRLAPPPRQVQLAACSWLPQEWHLYGSSGPARWPAWPSVEGKGERSDPTPSPDSPPLPPGWAEREWRLDKGESMSNMQLLYYYYYYCSWFLTFWRHPPASLRDSR